MKLSKYLDILHIDCQNLSIASRYVSTLLIIFPVIICEYALFHGYLDLTLWGYFLVFIGSTIAPLFTNESTATDLFRAFALIPLFRLLNLGLPVLIDTRIMWLSVVYGLLFMAAYILSINLSAVKFPTIRDVGRALLFLPAILAGAAVLASIEYAIIDPASLIDTWNLNQILLLTFVMIVFVGFVEELVFRGILQRTIEAHAGRITAILVSSVIFGAMHASLQLPREIGFGIGIGVLFALLYDWTDNLIIVTLIHGIQNVLLYGVFPAFGPVFVL